MNNHVYQIYYSDETRAAIEPGFIPLDNTGQRPDWYEYWPIRRVLLGNALDADARYGFLSPKFTHKTGLSSAQVADFLASTPDDVDVVTFSPYFSNAAFFKNVFEQAEFFHPGITRTISGALKLLAPGTDGDALIDGLVMSSVETVYSNYFIAKPRFWQRWLALCEIIFDAAEAGGTELTGQLNDNVFYTPPTPAKVFVIERMASLILSTEPGAWKVRNYDSAALIADNGLLDGKYRDEMVVLDALKFAAISSGARTYYNQFFNARERIIDRYKASRDEAAAAPSHNKKRRKR